MLIKQMLVAGLIATSLTSTATAVEETEAKTASQIQIEVINEKYRDKFAALEREGKQIADEAPKPSKTEGFIGVKGKIDWKITTMKFDVLEVFMKTRKFSLHLPQFAMRTTKASFDVPEVFMAITKVAPYPCFQDFKTYTCWITTKVPQTRMKRVEVKFDLPQVSWDVYSHS